MAATQNKLAENTQSVKNPENQQLAASERFTSKVMKEFGSNVAGELQVTEFQRQLIQGYFIAIDRALKTAEDNRQRKNEGNKDHKYDNPLPFTWDNVNLGDLALDVVHYARMGLDMMQDNHLFPIPFKNNKTGKYDVTLMPGYNGIQYIAERYAVDKPAAVTVELVYSTDTFKPAKKGAANKVEGYEFTINNPFDRGEIIGGFGYIEYDDPLKNKLVLMTRKDIEKRKPQHASAEFWGGTITKWDKGQKTEEQTDGWFEEMCLKTLKREVFSAKHIPRDPQKIDDAYRYMKMREAKIAEMEAEAEIDASANAVVIDTTPVALLEPQPALHFDQSTGEVKEPAKPVSAPAATAEAAQTMGPNF